MSDLLPKLEEWVSQNKLTYSFEERGDDWWIFLHPAEDALNFEPEIVVSFQKSWEQKEQYVIFIRRNTGPLLSWQQLFSWFKGDLNSIESITKKLQEIIAAASKVSRKTED